MQRGGAAKSCACVSALLLGIVLTACPTPPPPTPSAPSTVASIASSDHDPSLDASTDARSPANSATSCDPKQLTKIRTGCRTLRVDNVVATAGSETAKLVVDDSTCTSWNAGAFAIQSITLDLGEQKFFDGVELVANMTPDGDVHHVIESSPDNAIYYPRAEYEGSMFSGQDYWLSLTGSDSAARYVRVTTYKSKSWVAWSEIKVVTCNDGAPIVPPDAGPPPKKTKNETPPKPKKKVWARIVPGTGACHTDSDCVPEGCCSPSTCGSRPSLNHCANQGECSGGCRGLMACGHGACVCDHGKCATGTDRSLSDPECQFGLCQ